MPMQGSLTRSIGCTLAALLVLTPGRPAHAQFNADPARPAYGPSDLRAVQSSELIGHLVPTTALDTSFATHLVIADVGPRRYDVVSDRLTFTPAVGMGLFGIMDLQLALPYAAAESGRPPGGATLPRSALGDIVLATRAPVPGLSRRGAGFGLSIGASFSFPTGSASAFTGDGAVTETTMLLADYRTSFGMLIAANVGFWARPDAVVGSVHVASAIPYGLGVELPLAEAWGVSLLAELYGDPGIAGARTVPLEGEFGIRWRTSSGVDATAGFGAGSALGLAEPGARTFLMLSWRPRHRRPVEVDPPHSMLRRSPRAPPAPVDDGEGAERPESDRDGDGVVDRLDVCPDVPQGARGRSGCPVAFADEDEIVTLDEIRFPADLDAALPESRLLIAAVASVLRAHPELGLVRVEHHVDAVSAYALKLSEARAASVVKALVADGVNGSRLEAVGRMRPLDGKAQRCDGPLGEVLAACRETATTSGRIVFRIERDAPR